MFRILSRERPVKIKIPAENAICRFMTLEDTGINGLNVNTNTTPTYNLRMVLKYSKYSGAFLQIPRYATTYKT